MPQTIAARCLVRTVASCSYGQGPRIAAIYSRCGGVIARRFACDRNAMRTSRHGWACPGRPSRYPAVRMTGTGPSMTIGPRFIQRRSATTVTESVHGAARRPRCFRLMPARTSVVIMGGGIIGTSTAFFLARKGMPVVLCEKGHIAGEQSSRNWGWCRQMGRDPREIPLAIEALRLWGEMNRRSRAKPAFAIAASSICARRRRPGEERGVAGCRAAVSARHAHADDAEAAEECARADRRMGRRAVYRQRWPRRAAEGGPGDCGGGAPPWARVLTQCAVRGIETQGRARRRAW